MQTMYEIINAPTPTELIILKATVLPILIKDIRAVKKKEKMIALTGSWKRAFTCWEGQYPGHLDFRVKGTYMR